MSPSGLSIHEHLTEVAVELYERQFKETKYLYGLRDRELVLIISSYFQEIEIAELMKREQNDKKTEKLYACDICRKSFKFKRNSIKCKRKHEEKSEEIKQNALVSNSIIYSCDICKKGFTRSDDLVHHKTIHSEETNGKRLKTDINLLPDMCDESIKQYDISTYVKDNFSLVDVYNTNQIKEEVKETNDFSTSCSDPLETVAVKEEYDNAIDIEDFPLNASIEKAVEGQGEEVVTSKSIHHKYRTCGVDGCLPCNQPSCGTCKSCVDNNGKKRCLLRACARYSQQLRKKAKNRGDLTCLLCGAEFTMKCNLTKHLRKETCGKVSPKYGNLSTRCNGCMMVFPDKAAYSVHAITMRRKKELGHDRHEYQCKDCEPKAWFWPAAMTRHKMYHTNLQQSAQVAA